MNSIYRIIITLLFTSLVACTYNQPADTSSITTAGNEDEDIGIGGTGKQLASESGIGGTGKQPVGILGTITGFGSIFVNGIEIEYDENTPFSIDGKPSPMQQLAIGDVVEVLTTDENTFTHTKSINLRHEIIGQVEEVNPETFSFSVKGQSIVQPFNRVNMPVVGSWVAVSGIRIDKDSILASKISPADQGQTLIRSRTTLPFEEQTSRWLIQTYVPDNHASFELEGNIHRLQLAQPEEDAGQHRLAIKILKLHMEKPGLIELDDVFEPDSLPRGVQTLVPGSQSGNSTLPTNYDQFPGASSGSNQGPLPRRYMPGTSTTRTNAHGASFPLELDDVFEPGSRVQVLVPGSQSGNSTLPTNYDQFPGASSGSNQGTLPGRYMPGTSTTRTNAPGASFPPSGQGKSPSPVQK